MKRRKKEEYLKQVGSRAAEVINEAIRRFALLHKKLNR